ncbi:U-box domain-containing protein 34-like [Macadamia integrifolia]|uniref:U-box domain-containing protein 34-like n=1 Tax=Macadamia integrifolia TaxID=60698 RepID=UPI001C4F0044|nr:U-box domain-containing protein 34-like [Macadamia integrifolia]
MSSSDGASTAATTTRNTVAVAVSGRRRRAVLWAMENLMPHADRFVLVHVMPVVDSIPTPSGKYIPIKQMEAGVVAMYMQDTKLKYEKIFLPFKRLCKISEMETLVLEDGNPAAALLRYASDSGIKRLVLGSSSTNCITRMVKGSDVPSTVLNSSPDTCDIYIVAKRKVIRKLANPISTAGSNAGQRLLTQREHGEGPITIYKPLYTSIRGTIYEASEVLSEVASSNLFSQTHIRGSFSSNSTSADYQGTHQNIGNTSHNFMTSLTDAKQSEVQAEVEKLRVELQTTIAMYNQACNELVYTQSKVQLLSSEYVEEARKLNDVLEREQNLRKIAAEERAKHLEALKKVEVARQLLAKETHERQVAEQNALKESAERLKMIDTLILSDKRYRRYTEEEIEVATGFFSNDKLIGEGGYGKVYKCSIDHTPVAVKVLLPDASDKKEEFLREVEVLSQIHHPHMVLLLGACPENGSLVYEYMENGSLDDYLLEGKGTPLPWSARFRISFEVACGLAFLHSTKPEPIVHRDLKPGNILLDRNYVSKIGDVGLAKIVSEIVPDNVTQYRDSILAGTIYYMDPEYQRTGTIRPKSDLYALGIITLQLLTARHPNGLLIAVENAINNGSLARILDNSVTDWPLVESEELARIALKCSKLRCRDRPDLESEVLPILKKLSDMAAASVKLQGSNICAPSYYFCPILQEVMEDPYIAADGFTYDYRAIKAWLERHTVSPVTGHSLPHTMLTPNKTLRSAIQEWKTRVSYSS